MSDAPQRFQYRAEGGTYQNLRGQPLEPLPEIDENSIAELCRIVRGLQFAMVDGADSDHADERRSGVRRPAPLLRFDHQGVRHRRTDHRGAAVGLPEPLVFAGDANEAVEMLSLAAQRGDGVPEAREAINGAYVFKPFRENGKPKKVLAISGGQVMHNALETLPEIEERFETGFRPRDVVPSRGTAPLEAVKKWAS
jgi:hypothetical protein